MVLYFRLHGLTHFLSMQDCCNNCGQKHIQFIFCLLTFVMDFNCNCTGLNPLYVYNLLSWIQALQAAYSSAWCTCTHALYTAHIYVLYYTVHVPMHCMVYMYPCTACMYNVHSSHCMYSVHICMHPCIVHYTHESSSLSWMGPNQHLLAPQTHNPFFPSD